MKVREVFLISEVVTDLEQGVQFYNKQENGIGDYFFESLLSDFESLRFFSGIHNKKFGYFRALSKRFPYAIYYEIKDEKVIIVAVLDMRRDPNWIKANIKKRKT